MIPNDAEIADGSLLYFGNHVEVPREDWSTAAINLDSLLVPISSLGEYYISDTCSLGMILK